MDSIRGVIFDAYGTLFDVNSISSLAEQLFPGRGPSIATVWREKQVEYSRLVTLSDPSPQGSRHYQPFWELTEAALRYTLDRLGLHGTEEQIRELMQGYARLDAYPECARVLRKLQSMGLTTAILSNGSPDMLKTAADSSGLTPCLDHLISVDGVRQYKTSPVCYDLAPSTLQMPTSELLFVSSNAWDALGATWHGFVTCWVNRQGLPFERLGPRPHITCQTLDGLPEALSST